VARRENTEKATTKNHTVQIRESRARADLHQLLLAGLAGAVVGIGSDFAGRAIIQYPHLLNARTSAPRAQNFWLNSPDWAHPGCTLRQRNPRITRAAASTTCHQPIFANVQYATPSGTASCCSRPRATLVLKLVERENDRFPSVMTFSKISCSRPSGFNCPLLS